MDPVSHAAHMNYQDLFPLYLIIKQIFSSFFFKYHLVLLLMWLILVSDWISPVIALQVLAAIRAYVASLARCML